MINTPEFLNAIIKQYILAMQYEREIERLQGNVELLKLKLEQTQQQLDTSLPPLEPDQPDNMKGIIDR